MVVANRKYKEAQKTSQNGVVPGWDLLDFEEIWGLPFYNIRPVEGEQE